jgi:hypothetical protein
MMGFLRGASQETVEKWRKHWPCSPCIHVLKVLSPIELRARVVTCYPNKIIYKDRLYSSHIQRNE